MTSFNGKKRRLREVCYTMQHLFLRVVPFVGNTRPESSTPSSLTIFSSGVSSGYLPAHSTALISLLSSTAGPPASISTTGMIESTFQWPVFLIKRLSTLIISLRTMVTPGVISTNRPISGHHPTLQPLPRPLIPGRRSSLPTLLVMN